MWFFELLEAHANMGGISSLRELQLLIDVVV